MYFLLLIPLFAFAQAHYDPNYCHDREKASGFTLRPNWMKSLPDNRLLHKISIPGTHDTMTYSGKGLFAFSHAVLTQTLNLQQQLNYGIRFLDIRCVYSNGAFAIHHGNFYLNANFDDVLGQVTRFLQENPSETILMRVKNEGDNDYNANFARTYERYIRKPEYKEFIYDAHSSTITLGEVRRKIVLLKQYRRCGPGGTCEDLCSDKGYGLNWNCPMFQENMQDKHDIIKVHGDIVKKFDLIAGAIQNAKKGSDKFFVNFMSASPLLSYPYFAASGKATAGTNDPKLWTGLTTASNYDEEHPYFPKENCIWGTCLIYYIGTNWFTADFINKPSNNVKFVGILVADFPGPNWINTVIKLNN